MSAANPLRLGVNIDHVATLRQARGTSYPDLLEAARLCIGAGADGLTIHLREDRRHIQDADVFRLKKHLGAPLNLEMANVPEIVEIALRARPEEVCLVPERRQERTTEGGLDAAGQRDALAPVLRALARAGIRASLFIAPEPEQVDAAAALGAPCIELHTGVYGDARPPDADGEIERQRAAALRAHALGLQVNAGHGLHTGNLPGLLRLPYLHTLNIGHSIVCRAVFCGLAEAVKETIRAMSAYRGGYA